MRRFFGHGLTGHGRLRMVRKIDGDDSSTTAADLRGGAGR